MFLLRLIFSTSKAAIQVVVCVSSTICIASPVGGQPYIPFGVDVQFNVVSIGPLGLVSEGRADLSAFATILATMSDYLSLGCMGAAKKGEYSKTAGYQQFLDYLDDYFRTIMTECFTYVSAYISPFNSGRDIVMKHFGRVFENLGDNAICAEIRGMWDWWNYLQGVQSEVCQPPGAITDAHIQTAITSGRRNMQVVVVALFDPILGQLDAQEFGVLTGDVESHVGSISTSGSSDSRSSATSSLGSDRRKELALRVLGDDSLEEYTMSDDADFLPEGDQDSASSVSPDVGMAHGGTKKKTRKHKYRTNRRSKSKSKSKPKSKMGSANRNRNRRIRIHTRKNTQVSKTKIKTMKIKSKKFPKRNISTYKIEKNKI
jgi:hypothetical protein